MRSERSRLRVLVIQVLVFSLFATLFARLYYLQVVSGETYHARAASQSLREIVVQPERGLIVDDQGRPLVANRTSWVVSVDRTLLGKLGRARLSASLVKRLARVLDMEPRPDPPEAAVDCGDDGQQGRRLLERVAVPAGADRRRRRQEPSRCGSSSSPRTTRP